MGPGGNFITSPEISQAFGETRDLLAGFEELLGGRVALRIMATTTIIYLGTGVKHEIQLVELGPGKGTLMDDILRVRWPLFLLLTPHADQTELDRLYHNYPIPVSASSTSTLSSLSRHAVQQRKLQAWDSEKGLKIHWRDSIDDMPTANGICTMLVARKFFDALPFHLIKVHSFKS